MVKSLSKIHRRLASRTLQKGFVLIGAGRTLGHQIARSLRFRESASAYASRTPLSAGDRKTWTWSGWVKRGNLSGIQYLFSGGTGGTDVTQQGFNFQASGALRFTGAASIYHDSIALFRDPSAHYHVVVAFDTTNATANDRIKMYVNGVRLAVSISNNPSLNLDYAINQAAAHRVGDWTGGGYSLDGYLSDVYFVDGQALTPTAFGELDSTGTYFKPKSPAQVRAAVAVGGGARGGFGANGFYLPFDDPTSIATLMADRSQIITQSAYSFSDPFDTFSGWTTNVVDGTTGGSLGVSGGALVPTSYGTGGSWYGPIAYRTLNNLTDFDITFSEVVIGNTSADLHSLELRAGIPGNDAYFRWYFADSWNDNEPLVTAQMLIGGVSQNSVNITEFSGDVRIVRVGNQLTYYRGGSLIGTYTCSTEMVTSVSIAFSRYQTYVVPTQSVGGITISGTQNSGLPNDWTANSISLTDGSTYDSMIDVPLGAGGNERGNYATLNPLDPTFTDAMGAYLSNGNLLYTGSGDYSIAKATIPFPTSGVFYIEVTLGASGAPGSGTLPAAIMRVGSQSYSANSYPTYNHSGYAYTYDRSGGIYKGSNTNSAIVTGLATVSNNDVVGMEFDAGAQTVKWWKGTTLLHTLNLSSAPDGFYGNDGGWMFACGLYGGTAPLAVNMGQHPYVNKAANSPTSKSLHTGRLPDPVGAARDPKSHFSVVAVTKSGDTNFTVPWDATLYDTLFEIKRRDLAGNWYQVDGLRGYDKYLSSNTTAGEVTDANVISVSGTIATLRSSLVDGVYVISMRKAGLVTDRTTNTSGTIASTVSVNRMSGFSILLWSGSSVVESSLGHGLGGVLELATTKALNSATDWPVYHSKLTAGYSLFLSTTHAQTSGNWYPATPPTSTVMSVGSLGNDSMNASGVNYVTYCIRSIPGYSKIGIFPGNSSTDGTLVDCGFRPRYVLIKRTDSADDWVLYDSTRDAYNVERSRLYPNYSLAEDYLDTMDFTSNGFKLRTASGTAYNSSGGTYSFLAIAESSFKYSNAR